MGKQAPRERLELVRPAGVDRPRSTVVDTVRVLAMDAVQKVGNGHPGTAMGLAPAATLLWQRFLRHDPSDPHWMGRDRFVLSLGHSSLTLYIQLYLCGYDVTLEDLQVVPHVGKPQPGHPEHGHTQGVETTTGPLGQGLGNAVGMAMAARYERQLLDPESAPGRVSSTTRSGASSPTETWRRASPPKPLLWPGHKPWAIWWWCGTTTTSRSRVTRPWPSPKTPWGATPPTAGTSSSSTGPPMAMSTCRPQRRVGGREGGNQLARRSSGCAQPSRGRPPRCKTLAKSHGSALGEEEVAATKRILGFDPDEHFAVDPEVLDARPRGRRAGQAASRRLGRPLRGLAGGQPRARGPARPADRAELPEGWESVSSGFRALGQGSSHPGSSGEVLNALGPVLPELFGGSADLAGSNNTTIKGSTRSCPASRTAVQSPLRYPRARHGLGDERHGAARQAPSVRRHVPRLQRLHASGGPTRCPHGASGRPTSGPTTRSASGEDGPTHQPVEHLTALRAIPGLDVVRPADANETAQAWAEILRRTTARPGFVSAGRTSRSLTGPTGGAARKPRGAATSWRKPGGQPDVIVLACGTEVAIALEAGDLESQGSPPGWSPSRAWSGSPSTRRIPRLPCSPRHDRLGYRSRLASLPPGGHSSGITGDR